MEGNEAEQKITWDLYRYSVDLLIYFFSFFNYTHSFNHFTLTKHNSQKKLRQLRENKINVENCVEKKNTLHNTISIRIPIGLDSNLFDCHGKKKNYFMNNAC